MLFYEHERMLVEKIFDGFQPLRAQKKNDEHEQLDTFKQFSSFINGAEATQMS